MYIKLEVDKNSKSSILISPIKTKEESSLLQIKFKKQKKI